MDQAAAAGVRRFVVLSGRGVEVFGDSFEPSMAEAERVVRAAGVDWTVIRPNNFSQNFDEDLFGAALREGGRLALPVGEAPEPFIDVEDIAEVVAALLTEDGHTGRTYELSGPRALTFTEAVAELAEAWERPLRFEHITADAYVTELAGQGVPEEIARPLADVLAWLPEGHNAKPTPDVQTILGRAPRDFTTYARTTRAPR
ncbi:NAD(P)H-binding protein [Streptomyces sp. NPDC050439]|uniref:NAD(P)H-binding protein n=1 Tax=unclassified Streptomyces TaxID=2593676 RepID=UPI00341D4748